MKPVFNNLRPDKVAVEFGKDREITLRLDEDDHGWYLRVTGDVPLIVRPAATNQILVYLQPE